MADNSMLTPRAGNQYFQVPYNIPSTLGNFYVGSPTEAASNFVPLPLDFINEKTSQIKSDYDKTKAITDTGASAIRDLLKASPYNTDKRSEVLKEYDLDNQANQMAQELVSNPLAAQKVLTKFDALRGRLMSDPRTQAIQKEYKNYIENIMPKEKSLLETGYADFYDANTGQWVQRDPVSQPAQYTENDLMKYYKENYDKVYKESVYNELKNDGLKLQTDPNGVMYYLDPRTNTNTVLNEGNYYTKRALWNVSQQFKNDPHEQASRIAKVRLGLGDDPQKWYDFVRNMASPQFFQKNEIKGGDPHIVKNDEKGTVNTGNPFDLATNDLILQSPYTADTQVTADLGKNPNLIPELEGQSKVLSYDIAQSILNAAEKDMQTEGNSLLEEILLYGNATDANGAVNKVTSEGLVDILGDYRDAQIANGNGDALLEGADGNMKKLTDMTPADFIHLGIGTDYKTLENKVGKAFAQKLQGQISQTVLALKETGDARNQVLVNDLADKLAQKAKIDEKVEYFNTIKKGVEEKVKQETGLSSEDYKMAEDFNKLYGNFATNDAGGFYRIEESQLNGLDLKDNPNFRVTKEVDNTYTVTPINKEKIFEINKKLDESKTMQDFRDGKLSIDRTLVSGIPTIEGNKTANSVYTKLFDEIYKKDTNALTAALLADAAGNGLSENNNTLEKIVKSKNPDFAYSTLDNTKTSTVIVNNENHGLPRFITTLTDGSGNKVSLEYKLPISGKSWVKLPYEMMQESDEKDREVGAAWLGAGSLDDQNTYFVRDFFNENLKLPDGKKIEINAGAGMKYVMTTEQGVKNIKKYDANGNLVPLRDMGSDLRGEKNTVNKISNPMEAMRYIGYDLYLNSIKPQTSTGSQGGASNTGKSYDPLKLTNRIN